MERRKFLIGMSAATITSVAGCMGGEGDGNNSGGDGGPKYDQNQQEAMFPTEDDMPDGWYSFELGDDSNGNESNSSNESSGGDQTGGDFEDQVAFADAETEEDLETVVLFMVHVYETEEEAQDWIEEARNRFDDQDYNPADYDEAFWANEPQMSLSVVRDSNAAGVVGGMQFAGLSWAPDKGTAIEHSETLYDVWQNV